MWVAMNQLLLSSMMGMYITALTGILSAVLGDQRLVSRAKYYKSQNTAGTKLNFWLHIKGCKLQVLKRLIIGVEF